MKVCLIAPILFSFQRARSRTLKNNVGMSYFPPLGLCYIANVLEKNGISVKIIDRNVLMTANGGNLRRVNEITLCELKSYSADVAGIGTTTPTFYDVTENILGIVRRLNKDTKVIVGGPHASALPEHILRSNLDIDIVCRGEGETAVLDIVKGCKTEHIAGITYRNHTGIVSNPDREPFPNIDEFCFPARHLVDMEYYCSANPFVMHGLYMRATTIFTSRGCAYDCTFCAGKVAIGKKVRFQSPDLVIEEIEMLIRKYRIEGVYFADDMFDLNKERARIICEKLIRKGLHKKIRWYPQLRANTIDKDMVTLMKRAGAVRADIGFESGSQKTLDVINKRTTVQQNYHAAKTLYDNGMQFQANMIVGLPGEDIDDMRATESFMKRIHPSWIGFGEFIPLPGTKLYQDLIAKGLLKPDEAGSIGKMNFTKVDNATFEKFIGDIRKKIVIPLRVKSYIFHNMFKPGAFIFIFKLLLNNLLGRR